MIKTAKLFIDPYGDEIRIIKTSNFKEAEDYLFKNQPSDWNKTSDILKQTYANKGACFYSFEDLHFVFFMKTPASIEDIAEVTHESLHLVYQILSRRGLELKQDTQEAYTYLLQFIVKEILHFLKYKKS